MPSLLTQTDNWGAFLFFAGWCFVALIYVFFVVPETAGQGLEDLDALFERPIWQAYRSTQKEKRHADVEICEDSSVPLPPYPRIWNASQNDWQRLMYII